SGFCELRAFGGELETQLQREHKNAQTNGSAGTRSAMENCDDRNAGMYAQGWEMDRRLSSWLGPGREATSAGHPLRVPLVFLVALIGAELAALMMLNHGAITYTLDDAYIHLALAEHISHGHYGINATEFSAPSSSIAWPFILAPAARFEI